MKAFKQVWCVIIFSLFLSACAKPLISNLQKGSYQYLTTTDDVLKVSVSVLPLPKPVEEQVKPKLFLDLRDSLPHIYMKILSSKVAEPDKLIGYLTKPLAEEAKSTPKKKETDFTFYKVKFSFSNLKKYYNDIKYMHPNTRLEYLTTSLNIPDKSAISFYNIDKLENEFDEIDLGTLSRDQTVSLNAKIAGELGAGSSSTSVSGNKNVNTANDQTVSKQNVYDGKGNVIGTMDNSAISGGNKESTSTNTTTSDAKGKGTGEVGYLNTQSIKEAIAVKLKRLRTGFHFSPGKLIIAQRGRPLGDISDNIYISTTLKVSNPTNVFSLNVYDFQALFNSSNEPSKASEITFSSRTVSFVPCDKAEDITLTTDFEGAIRAVQSDKKNPGVNALEYDDKVIFYKFGNTKGDNVVFDKNLYCKNAYKIIAKDKNGNNLVLKIAVPVPEELDIFIDDKPELLLQWIIEQLVSPVASNLATNKYKMYFENIVNKSRIYLVNNTLTATDINILKELTDIKMEKRVQ